jgi:hypothetical protein
MAVAYRNKRADVAKVVDTKLSRGMFAYHITKKLSAMCLLVENHQVATIPRFLNPH